MHSGRRRGSRSREWAAGAVRWCVSRCVTMLPVALSTVVDKPRLRGQPGRQPPDRPAEVTDLLWRLWQLSLPRCCPPLSFSFSLCRCWQRRWQWQAMRLSPLRTGSTAAASAVAVEERSPLALLQPLAPSWPPAAAAAAASVACTVGAGWRSSSPLSRSAAAALSADEAES